jgi:hypothetical protein
VEVLLYNKKPSPDIWGGQWIGTDGGTEDYLIKSILFFRTLFPALKT